MRYRDNDCVGCPQGCVHCGREHGYTVIACDKCGEDIAPIYEYDGKELCMDCIIQGYGEHGECIECGDESILIDGLCPECLEDVLEEVREE